MEYRNNKKIKLCSVILILLGIIWCVFGLLGLVIPTAMPDSIGAYFIRELYEQPTIILGPPSFILTIGVDYLVFGAIALYIYSRRYSIRAIKTLGIVFIFVNLVICLLNMLLVFDQPLNIGVIIVLVIASLIGIQFITASDQDE